MRRKFPPLVVVSLLLMAFPPRIAADIVASKKIFDASVELLSVQKDLNTARKAARLGLASKIEIESLGDVRWEIREAQLLTGALSDMVLVGCDSELGREIVANRRTYTLASLKDSPATIREYASDISNYTHRSLAQSAATKVLEVFDTIEGIRDLCSPKRDAGDIKRQSGPTGRTIGSAPGK